MRKVVCSFDHVPDHLRLMKVLEPSGKIDHSLKAKNKERIGAELYWSGLRATYSSITKAANEQKIFLGGKAREDFRNGVPLRLENGMIFWRTGDQIPDGVPV